MNNRFLFRSWDKKNKVMLDCTCVEDMLFSYGANFDHISSSDAILLQSTGLKDKDGVLIFESDILRLQIVAEYLICHVVWNDDESQYKMQHPRGYHGEYGFTKQIFESCPVEVIGNIYINPELMKDL